MRKQIRKNDIKIAVMGCVVNGPGEAREADIVIGCSGSSLCQAVGVGRERLKVVFGCVCVTVYGLVK